MRNPAPLPFTPRNIVILSDGTGNSAAKLFKTNVWRMYDALDLSCPDQVAFYDDGVGTASFKPLAVMGGAFGFGLKRNVLDLYMFLCRNYRVCEDGRHDKIFAFGFSRGAFTARVVSALVAHEGLVQTEDDDELRRLATWAYRRYRASRYRHSLGVKFLRSMRNLAVRAYEWRKTRYDPVRNVQPEIEFLGVWDTVAAYGLPIDELTRGWDRWIWPMLPTSRELPASVKRACHAVALDDERQTFFPLLWNEQHEQDQNAKTTTLEDERISQVWFAGVHSNVGGGYPDDALSYTPLRWMAIEAQRKGLRFIPSLCDPKTNIPAAWIERAVPCAPKNDSRRGAAAYYRYHPRPVERLCADEDAGVRIARPKIHESVFVRLRDTLDDYATIVLPPRYAVVTAGRQILDGDANSVPAAARANPYEHSTQAESRRHLQEQAHDLVWKRRVLYFATVGVTLLAVLLPFVGFPWVAGRIHTISALVGIAGGMLPGVASTWIDYYSRYSVQFAIVAGAIALMLWRSGRLEQRLRNRMRAIWQESGLSARATQAIAPPPSTRIYRLRTSRAYVGGFRILSRSIWPNLFGLAMALTLAIIVPLRLGFEAASRASWLPASNCLASASDAVELATGRRADMKPLHASTDARGTFAFWPHMTCNATGVYAEEGQSYRVELALPDGSCSANETMVDPARRRTGQWTDRFTPINRDHPGFTTLDRLKANWSGLVFAAAQPVRRLLYANWFDPIASIGTSLPERHVLRPGAYDFRAGRSGPITLYVNDAIGLCWRWDCLYSNNAGGPARVRITRIDKDGRPIGTPGDAGAAGAAAVAGVAGTSGVAAAAAGQAGGAGLMSVSGLALAPLTPYDCPTQEALRVQLPESQRGDALAASPSTATATATATAAATGTLAAKATAATAATTGAPASAATSAVR